MHTIYNQELLWKERDIYLISTYFHALSGNETDHSTQLSGWVYAAP